MKNVFVLFSLVVAVGCSKVKTSTETQRTLAVVPVPVSSTIYEEDVKLSGRLTILADTEEARNVASLLETQLEGLGIESAITVTSEGVPFVLLKLANIPALGNEGYNLTIKQDQITIEANHGAGLFYGVQSFIQLISANNTVPSVDITDHPRFGYRGLHLDVGRHMFPVETIKKYIDLMAHYKFNTFHWHLTEDQGWRIEIKKYPKLTEVGGYRDETVIGHASTHDRGSEKYDGTRYGGFYTQDEVREIVAYAKKKYITIVPEIEMPGHALAALAAYPYLGCTGGPYKVAGTWGVFDDVFCAGKESTFEFLEDVIDEVVELFPGKYIHIGGDECPKTKWEECPHCQKRIKDEKLKDEHELQSYFIQRMEKYINSKGKSIIGWDEILEGGLAPNATVMNWRGEEGGIAAAKENHDVIMTPTKWCYLDYYQADPENEPLAIGGLLPVKQVYEYEPVPASLSSEEANHILGAQCNVWTEYIPSGEHLEYMVYPRAIAMSEVLWSAKDSRNYDNFVERMKQNRTLLDDWNVNYATHIFEEQKKDSINH